MSAWPIVYDAFVVADTVIVTTTETVVASVTGVTVPGAGNRVKLDGSVQVTIGTTATAITLRWRRGIDITGTLIGEGNPVQGTAANTVQASLQVTDTPGEIANQTYVLTVQQTGATANGTALQASGRATV
jgi:hypothetical protein